MTKIIGLTGGIGSGKTKVSNFFQELGVPIYIADIEAKKIIDQPEVIHLIEKNFGNVVFDDQLLNKQKLASIVFENPDKLEILNQIIHPLVKEHFMTWFKHQIEAPFVIKEAAILFESGSYNTCDKIITVTAPLAIRIERVIKRDQTTYEEVTKRMKNQWNDADKVALSDFVINNLDSEDTKNQVNKIYGILKDCYKKV